MKKILTSLLDLIRSFFFNGLLIVLPITLTTLLFNASFRLIKNWLNPLHDYLPEQLQAIPHSEILLTVVMVLTIGLFVRLFVLKPIIHMIEKNVLFRIPLVRPVYSGIKQLVGAFTSTDKLSFNTVVLLEFPSKGIHCIGFMTGEFPKSISPDQEQTYHNIYVPTTPNPTTGYFVLLPKDKFRIIDLTRQEAMSIIISGGIIKPDRFYNNQ